MLVSPVGWYTLGLRTSEKLMPLTITSGEMKFKMIKDDYKTAPFPDKSKVKFQCASCAWFQNQVLRGSTVQGRTSVQAPPITLSQYYKCAVHSKA